ncbi:MAG: hypothetical protein ABSH41_09055 [Syntrophobacteraceae bacterium]
MSSAPLSERLSTGCWCGVPEKYEELKLEIARLCNVVELLAEKVGLTVKERKEIESFHGGPI